MTQAGQTRKYGRRTSVKKMKEVLMELSDSVSLSNAGGRLRIKCTVFGLWEE